MPDGPVHFWRAWHRLARRVGARPLIVFLDFDGTLAPFVAHPERARIPPVLRSLLRRLATKPTRVVGIMSGRALPDVQKRVGIPGLIYAGNHGLEIEGRGLTFRHPGALAVTKELTALGRQVARAVRGLPGVRVEDKGLSWTLHVRRATAWTRRQALRVFWDVVGVAARRGRVRVRRGSMIREVLPPVTWDKGAAVRWILAHLRPGTRPLVIYVGDDLGDESAFAAVGRKGLSVVFGRRRRTRARFFLKSRHELQRLLQSLTLLGHGPAPCSRLIRRR